MCLWSPGGLRWPSLGASVVRTYQIGLRGGEAVRYSGLPRSPYVRQTHNINKVKRLFLLENIIIFLKFLTLIFILKYFQEHYRKPNNFSKLCKPKVTTPVHVPNKKENWSISDFFNKDEQELRKGLVRKWEFKENTQNARLRDDEYHCVITIEKLLKAVCIVEWVTIL